MTNPDFIHQRVEMDEDQPMAFQFYNQNSTPEQRVSESFLPAPQTQETIIVEQINESSNNGSLDKASNGDHYRSSTQQSLPSNPILIADSSPHPDYPNIIQSN